VVRPSVPGELPVEEPGRDPHLGDCHMGCGLPKPRWKCIVLRAEWHQDRKICGATNDPLREPGDTLLYSTFPEYAELRFEVTVYFSGTRGTKNGIRNKMKT
jgi:hypothetical protein